MRIQAILFLLRNVQREKYEKGAILVHEGEREKKIFFIRKGLIRSYKKDENGKELTFQLHPESTIFGNAHALLLDQGSQFYYEALEPSLVYAVNYEKFLKMAEGKPELYQLNQKFVSRRNIITAFQRVESLLFLSPEERYKNFLKERPDMVNRVPDKYIANVLGITPESLSRIRRRMAKPQD